ncbi:MAG: hypothetical protein NTX45_10935 [Proteobacteria bacterium]|nr:hypothetical protein [Pseudomonadota bacterium]
MAKFGEKNRTFVVKAAAIAAQNPDILPRSFNLDEMMADVSIIEDLYPLIATAANLLGKLEDTYSAALLVYQYAKTANVATSVLENALTDLGHRFVKHPKTPLRDTRFSPIRQRRSPELTEWGGERVSRSWFDRLTTNGL